MQRKFKIKRSVLACIIVAILIPITLLISWKYFEKNYYVTTFLIILYTMLPFFIMFEKRTPQARELVTIAVMCALAIAARAAFIWLPAFKPMAAIIIVIGIALGAEVGFLSGAVSLLISNFIFGQGPWTPWQMFAFGMAGFLAGIFYKAKIITKNRVGLSVFGAILIMVVIGPLLDTSTLFMGVTSMTKESVLSIYLSGVPVNAVHAVATFLTLFLFSTPLFEKLDRIKMKYGMLEEES